MIRRLQTLDYEYLADIDDFDDDSSNDEGFGSAIDSSGGFTAISDNSQFPSILPTMFEDDEEIDKSETANKSQIRMLRNERNSLLSDDNIWGVKEYQDVSIVV